MIVYPAIDIRGGRCVRLIEGDFQRETAYDADPVDAAKRWAAAGAEWLHMVDLDGAVAGEPVNGEVIRRVRAAVDLPIQLGGGMRALAHLESAFDLGVNRVILGTAALENPGLVNAALARWGEAVAVSLDARDGKLASAGWLSQSEVRATDAARDLRARGVQTFVATDIARDGKLAGPNLDALAELVGILGAEVIASGGISSLDDIRGAAAIGCTGAITGRALYDGRISLAGAIEAARETERVQR